MSGDHETVGWDCLLSPELVILMLCRNYQYMWERMSSIWEKCLDEERNRDQEGRGGGKAESVSALTGLRMSTGREREMFIEKRKGGRKGRKEASSLGFEGTQEERWGKKRDKKQSKQ